jgi:hypothetical protein
MQPPLEDVLFHKAKGEGIARLSINRPDLHNAFRPRTVLELGRCLDKAQDDVTVRPLVGVDPTALIKHLPTGWRGADLLQQGRDMTTSRSVRRC